MLLSCDDPSQLTGNLQIILDGRFRAMSEDGTEVTPRSAKGQGLLALLAASPDHTRTRVWLRDMLWSDRMETQGNGSLRQCLSDIRNSLGADQDVLQITRTTVSLDMSRVTIRPWEPAGPNTFLEGMDIRDPEFEDWLRTARNVDVPDAPAVSAVLAAPGAVSAPPASATDDVLIYIQSSERQLWAEQFFSDMVADEASKALQDFLGCGVTILAPNAPPPKTGVLVTFDAFSDMPNMTLRTQAKWAATQSSIWATTRRFVCAGGPPIDNEGLHQLLHSLVLCVSFAFETAQRSHLNPFRSDTAQFLGAARNVLSLNPSAMDQSEAYLAQVDEGPYRAMALSWRAILGVIRALERFGPERSIDRETPLIYARQAVEANPFSALALSAQAYATLQLGGNVPLAAELARRAIELNPSNPFGWLTKAFCDISGSDMEDAHRGMLRARTLETISSNRFFWDSMTAVSAAATGRHELSRQLMLNAHALKPEFKPPLRYLISLNAHLGDHDLARDVTQKLIQLEPDFSVSRLLDDPAYPSAMLKRTGVLTKAAVEPLL